MMTPDSHAAPAHGVHWGYTGDTGPDHWGGLCPEFALCACGCAQSPIDLRDALADGTLAPVAYDYQPTPVMIQNNGHTIQVDNQQPNGIILEGVRYDLVQFHFHAPSEHTIEGRTFAMEAHLVHRSAQGALAVVGVMLEPGAVNVGLAGLWTQLPVSECSCHLCQGFWVNPTALLPADHRSFRYQGSLTTPPGTEGVSWVVLAEPISVSLAQINRFRAIMCGNARPVQPCNGRAILLAEE
jgi:carbonic anhydrase